MAGSNELIKKDFNIDSDSVPLDEEKFNRLVEEKSYEFQNLKEKINPNNLIYKYKTVGRSLKDLSDLIDLFFYNFIFYLYLYIKIRRPNFFWFKRKINFFRDYSILISEVKYKAKYGGLKILYPKQILQRLTIALAQVKAGNTSKNFLNEITQIMYSLYLEKVTKKVYHNIMNSIEFILYDSTEWILYLWILRIVKHLILIEYYSILQTINQIKPKEKW